MTRRNFSSGSLVIATTVPSAINLFVLPQVPALLDAGWDVHLVSSPGIRTPVDLQDRIHIHELPMERSVRPVADAVALKNWVALLREIRPEVLLGSSPKAGMLSMVAGRLAGVPRRIFLHRGARWETATGYNRRVLMAADRLTVQSATATVAVSNSLADLLVSSGIAKDRPVVFGNGGSKGVDLARFHPPVGLPSAEGPVTLGFVGRLSRDKGINTLLRVFDGVCEVLPDTRLLVVGARDEVDEIDTQLLRRIEDEPAIEWVGHADDVVPFMQRMDVLIFPSLREGLPNVVIEAAACGVPTVGWRVTGVTDAVAEGISGSTVTAHDLAALIPAALSFATADREQTRTNSRAWSRGFDQQALTAALVAYLA